jgi:hypothetical protein
MEESACTWVRALPTSDCDDNTGVGRLSATLGSWTVVVRHGIRRQPSPSITQPSAHICTVTTSLIKSSTTSFDSTNWTWSYTSIVSNAGSELSGGDRLLWTYATVVLEPRITIPNWRIISVDARYKLRHSVSEDLRIVEMTRAMVHWVYGRKYSRLSCRLYAKAQTKIANLLSAGCLPGSSPLISMHQ